jgi:hypothetical protein
MPAARAPVIGSYRFWRDMGYVAGGLTAGIAADALGFGGSIAVVAGLTAASGIWVAIDMPRVVTSQSRLERRVRVRPRRRLRDRVRLAGRGRAQEHPRALAAVYGRVGLGTGAEHTPTPAHRARDHRRHLGVGRLRCGCDGPCDGLSTPRPRRNPFGRASRRHSGGSPFDGIRPLCRQEAAQTGEKLSSPDRIRTCGLRFRRTSVRPRNLAVLQGSWFRKTADALVNVVDRYGSF